MSAIPRVRVRDSGALWGREGSPWGKLHPCRMLLHFPPDSCCISPLQAPPSASTCTASRPSGRSVRRRCGAPERSAPTRTPHPPLSTRAPRWVGGGWVVLRAGGWGCTPLGDIMFSMWARIAVMEAGARPPHLPDCAAALPLPATPFPAAAPWPCHSLAPAPPPLPPAEAG